jgi:hypothetical protein
MLHKLPRRLPVILLSAVCAIVLGAVLDLSLKRLSSAYQGVARYDSEVIRLRRLLAPGPDLLIERDQLRARVSAGASRFYAADFLTAYTFGELVKQKLASCSMKVQHYQVIEVKGRSFLEFSVTGSARGMVFFIRAVSQQEKYWSIPSATIIEHPDGGSIDAVFRIGYEVDNSKIN